MGPQIIQGQDKILAVRLNSGSTGDAFDFTGATEIDVMFQNTDGTCLHKKLSTSGVTILSAAGGKFQVTLLAVETALLLVSADPTDPTQLSGLEVHVTLASKVSILNLANVVTIIPRLFPNC